LYKTIPIPYLTSSPKLSKAANIMNSVNESKLVRGLSRLDMVAITINSIIGAGIFGLLSKAAALIGANSLFAFIAWGAPPRPTSLDGTVVP
jgi:hypothetical protein